MPTFQWNETYSVGVKTFDDHHQHLISLINQLYEAMRSGQGQKELYQILSQLIDYTSFHFSSEENEMARRNYPGLAKHRAEHKLLKEKVLQYQVQMQTGKLGLSVQVANFLKEWLLNHILVDDKKYGPYLQGQK